MQSLAQPGIMQSLADFEPEPEGAGGRAQQRGSRWGPREVDLLLGKTVSFLLSKHFLRKCEKLVHVKFEKLGLFLHFRKCPIIVILRQSQPVLWIRDILVRIRILVSVPLSNGSGCGSKRS